MRVAVLLVVLAGCATRYEYSFQPAQPAFGDADLTAAIAIDATAGALHLDLENRTDEVLQVAWNEIAITKAGGRVATLRPDADLGWIPPGQRVSAKLLRIALPREDGAAAANDGRRFEVDVPVIVRREPKVYHFTLVAHLREI